MISAKELIEYIEKEKEIPLTRIANGLCAYVEVRGILITLIPFFARYFRKYHL